MSTVDTASEQMSWPPGAKRQISFYSTQKSDLNSIVFKNQIYTNYLLICQIE